MRRRKVLVRLDRHVSEEGLEVHVEEVLDDAEIEFCVDEERGDVGFDDVGEALGRLADRHPVVHSAVCFALGFLQLHDVVADLGGEDGSVLPDMCVPAQLDADGAEEFVGYHGCFVLGEPLWVFLGVFVEEVHDECHV